MTALDTVRAAVATVDGRFTLRSLREILPDVENLAVHLHKLHANGELERCQINGRQYQYWRPGTGLTAAHELSAAIARWPALQHWYAVGRGICYPAGYGTRKAEAACD